MVVSPADVVEAATVAEFADPDAVETAVSAAPASGSANVEAVPGGMAAMATAFAVVAVETAGVAVLELALVDAVEAALAALANAAVVATADIVVGAGPASADVVEAESAGVAAVVTAFVDAVAVLAAVVQPVGSVRLHFAAGQGPRLPAEQDRPG